MKAPANIPSARMVPIVSGSLLCSPNLAFTPVMLDGCLASAAVCASDKLCTFTVSALHCLRARLNAAALSEVESLCRFDLQAAGCASTSCCSHPRFVGRPRARA